MSLGGLLSTQEASLERWVSALGCRVQGLGTATAASQGWEVGLSDLAGASGLQAERAE